MKVGIITFHASHNYGSMLQAYALQQTVLSLGHECEIINLRTSAQRKMYRPFYKQPGWIKKLKAIRYPLLALDDVRKHHLFEKFLNTNYQLSSKTYSSADALSKAQHDYDCYISGSDQIWNTNCSDFSTSYFLDFVKKGRCIAYAPSMGPLPFRVDISSQFRLANLLEQYQAISVREPNTAERIKQLTGKNAIVTADPTLLLSTFQWSSLAGEKPLVKGEYILLYTPWYEEYKELYEQAAALAANNCINIVCTIPEACNLWHKNPYFKYFTAVGPIEFLNLIKYSKSILCGSFHAVVFSLIFGKPFYAYKGMDDSRISHLLNHIGLEKCADSIESTDSIDVFHAYDKLKPFIDSSRRFLKESLQ